MVKRILLSIFVSTLFITSLSAQEEDVEYNVMYKRVENGETFYNIYLAPAVVYNRTFKKKKDYREFYKLVWNLHKVYPYSVVVKAKMKELDSKYVSFKDKKDKKEFIKSLEKDLFAEFEGPLRKLSRTQGKVLMKLVDRETGQTSYQLIKEFKGGFMAGFWQTTARIFGNNLKTNYDKEGEDALLEELVLMCEDGSFEYLYQSMFGYLENK